MIYSRSNNNARVESLHAVTTLERRGRCQYSTCYICRKVDSRMPATYLVHDPVHHRHARAKKNQTAPSLRLRPDQTELLCLALVIRDLSLSAEYVAQATWIPSVTLRKLSTRRVSGLFHRTVGRALACYLWSGDSMSSRSWGQAVGATMAACPAGTKASLQSNCTGLTLRQARVGPLGSGHLVGGMERHNSWHNGALPADDNLVLQGPETVGHVVCAR